MWTLTRGSHLPAGLHLSADGSISGTPTRTGNYRFTISVNDPITAGLTLQVRAPAAGAAPAGSSSAQLTGTTTATGPSTPAASGLADTGTPTTSLVGLALLLLITGAATVLTGLHRPRRGSADAG